MLLFYILFDSPLLFIIAVIKQLGCCDITKQASELGRTSERSVLDGIGDQVSLFVAPQPNYVRYKYDPHLYRT